jgi:hypothetical protein
MLSAARTYLNLLFLCTFEFLISTTPYLQTHQIGGYPSVGVAVKHRQMAGGGQALGEREERTAPMARAGGANNGRDGGGAWVREERAVAGLGSRRNGGANGRDSPARVEQTGGDWRAAVAWLKRTAVGQGYELTGDQVPPTGGSAAH